MRKVSRKRGMALLDAGGVMQGLTWEGPFAYLVIREAPRPDAMAYLMHVSDDEAVSLGGRLNEIEA